METNEFTQKKCKPCEGGVAPLTSDQTRTYLKKLNGWSLKENKIEKEFVFKKFMDSIAFVNRVAQIAESEGHHPDLHVYFKTVKVELWTHAISGLSENDFIVAAKIDAFTS